jgi:hypothetical protein
MSPNSFSDRLERLLSQASRLISHAESLMDRGEAAASGVEWRFAAEIEEEVAGLLEISGDEVEAAIHRVSAASCYRQIGEHFRAMTLLHAATATASLGLGTPSECGNEGSSPRRSGPGPARG